MGRRGTSGTSGSRNTVAGVGTDVSAVTSPDSLTEDVVDPVPLLDVVAESPPPETEGGERP